MNLEERDDLIEHAVRSRSTPYLIAIQFPDAESIDSSNDARLLK